MPAPAPAAATFWDAYFENRFVTLQRGDGGYRGQVRTDPAGAPGHLLRAPEDGLVALDCSFSALQAHDYGGDGRFALLDQRPADIDDAVARLIDQSYPYRDPAPFGKARMAELMRQWQPDLAGQAGRIALPAVEQRLVDLVDHHAPGLDAAIAALAWLLGEFRQASSAPALLAVVRNSAGVPFARHTVHFSAVNAAFSALWKVNGKSVVRDLLVLMDDASPSGRRQIAALFERLYSTAELLSLARCGEDYLRPGFWREHLEPRLDAASSQRIDVANLFWEIRLSVVPRLGLADIAALQVLAGDEVEPVRRAALRRLDGLGSARATVGS